MEITENQLRESQAELLAIYDFIESLPKEVLAPTKMKWKRFSIIEEVRETAKDYAQLKFHAQQLRELGSRKSLIFVRNHLQAEKELCSRTYDNSVSFNSASFLTLGLIFVGLIFYQSLLRNLLGIYLVIFVGLVIKVIVTSQRYLQEYNLLNKLEALLEMAEQDVNE